MAATFAFDGISVLSCTFDSVIGQEYWLWADDLDSSPSGTTAIATTTTLTVTGIGGAARFFVVLRHSRGAFVLAGDYLAATVFALGSTSEYVFGAVWAFDGNETVTVTFPTVNGVNYLMQALDTTNGGSPPGTVSGDGTTKTATTTFPSPATGDYFFASLADTPFTTDLTCRLFQGGVAGAGVPGNPVGPPPAAAPRFPNGTRARMVVTDLDTETTAWLDRLLLQGTVTAQLNLPWQITGSVRSSDPQVNRIFAPDSDPRVAQSNRLVYVFLRDGPDQNNPIPAQRNAPWQCRASGILMSPEDQGDADIGTTHFTAYDPWQYLMGLPCFETGAGSSAGQAIGPLGRAFFATSGAVIAATLLADTIAGIRSLLGLPDFTSFIDAGLTYEGTSFWTGTLEATPLLDFTVQQGMTLGDAWNQLVAAGDPTGGTGGMDIVLQPIWDPVNRPGYASQLSIYNLAGSVKALTPMAWGRFSRTSTTADRQNDGTPGNFVNVADFHVGQGGLPVPVGGPPPSNGLAVAKYGPYWLSSFFPAQNESSAVAAMETQALILQKQGKRTFPLDPDPIRAAAPFRDYGIGDRIRVMTTDSLRVSESGFHRIEGIPLQINPDGITLVQQLLVTPDWRGA